MKSNRVFIKLQPTFTAWRWPVSVILPLAWPYIYLLRPMYKSSLALQKLKGDILSPGWRQPLLHAAAAIKEIVQPPAEKVVAIGKVASPKVTAAVATPNKK